MTSTSLFASGTPGIMHVHRVLMTPQLIDLTFSFLDRHSNAANACVCKTWSDVALAALWKDVHDLWRLVCLLAPLKKTQGSTYELVRTPQTTDWLRFSRYGHLVRRLHYSIHSPTHKHLHPSIFDEIARTRTQSHILPNLHTLEWSLHDLRMSALFMLGKVKRFTVLVPFDEGQVHLEGVDGELIPYFQDLVVCMPHLTHLDFCMDIPDRLINIYRTAILSHFPSLRAQIPRAD